MRKAALRIGGLVAAAGTALTLATVGPAFASTAAKTMTGPEVVSGSAHGAAAIANVTPMPLTLVGVVATTEPGFKFADATGPGAYQIYFAAYQPRFTSGKHKGECNENANPLAKGAVATFLAAGVLTVNG